MDDVGVIAFVEWSVALVEERFSKLVAWIVALVMLLGIPVAVIAALSGGSRARSNT